MKVDLWFPVSILVTNLDPNDHDLGKMVAKAYEIYEKYPADNDWRCDTYTSYSKYNMLEDKDFASLTSSLIPIVKEFSKYYGVKEKEVVCNNAWINLAEHGAYQEYHVHPHNHFSAVVYLQTAPNCGDIVFKNPMSVSDMFELDVEERNPSNFVTCAYTPENLKVLIFRSNILHMVEKNRSAMDRISVALNFTV
jgi:uncharacterized protein (TIGR02466 family)